VAVALPAHPLEPGLRFNHLCFGSKIFFLKKERMKNGNEECMRFSACVERPEHFSFLQNKKSLHISLSSGELLHIFFMTTCMHAWVNLHKKVLFKLFLTNNINSSCKSLLSCMQCVQAASLLEGETLTCGPLFEATVSLYVHPYLYFRWRTFFFVCFLHFF